MMPKIACIGVIGKADNPIHITLFPPYRNSAIEFSILVNSCLDIIEIRRRQTSIDQDLGLLHAIDESLAAYGWLTTTGVKLLVIVDLVGQTISPEGFGASSRTILKGPDLRPVFRSLQDAYVQLLQNPFYTPSERSDTVKRPARVSSFPQVADKRFVKEILRIGESWAPH
ncbi:Sedlin [Aspergillus violaceofuscus CBS 115571]|uniref:Sedlin n=2 Tax=Aspergillus TaxID=5052 RepID=A0A2V5HGG7_ASPV1|nr:Sedlin [Aspergillus violaceofuscus CBS 115571]